MGEATLPSTTGPDVMSVEALGDAHPDDATGTVGGVGGAGAEPVDDVEEPEDDRPRFVRFLLGDRELLVGVESVLEVLVVGPVTRLPGAVDAIAGVTSVRGRIVAVVDASAALGASAPADHDRFLVVSTPGGPVALVVDRVDAVVAADVDPLPSSPAPDGDPSAGPLVVATATIDGRTYPVIDATAVIEASIAWAAPVAATP